MTDDRIEAALLPCPFCGGTATVVGRGPFHVWCMECSTRGSLHMDMSPDRAIAAWNRRAAITAYHAAPEAKPAQVLLERRTGQS